MPREVGLKDKPRPGARPVYTDATDKRILAMLDQPVPKGRARWDSKLLAKELGDIDVNYVRRFLRKQKIDLASRKSWCESKDPEFAAKAADVVGLYMSPPENAVVLCIDEKPSIQALERAQGYLKLPNGHALTGHSHDYKRNGTTTLFAAYEVATGKVVAKHEKRRRRKCLMAALRAAMQRCEAELARRQPDHYRRLVETAVGRQLQAGRVEGVGWGFRH